MKAMALPVNQYPSAAGFAKRLALALVVFLCSALTSVAWADPPGRVGRLGDMTGQVWLFSPDGGEWVEAPRNRPLTSGDRVATDANAHAEVRIGSATVRLDSGTELEVLRIDDDHIALQLHNGSIATHLRTSESAREFELRTAEGRFITPRAGRYRFDRADETSNVTVMSGEAVFEGPGSALTVNAGQRAEFWLDNNAAQYSITDPVRDSFASWSADQDRRDERSASTRYVSPEMTGAEDLDRYGRWEQAPEYGAVWIPRAVPVDWAPYRAGHWAWISPWGWTWVDDQPWGFAPFHYGRWAMFHDRWCWVPGTYVRRPVYAPALVAWVGGPQVNVSINIGNSGPAVGWFPLAPREVYVPSYRVSPHYVQQVNITHVTNITNVTTIVNNPQQAVMNVDYRNRQYPRAITVVPQTVFVNRQPVAPVAAQLRNSTPMQQMLAAAQQKVVAPTPPVPAPQVDGVRRHHGFGPDGPRASAGVGPAAVAAPTAPTAQNLTSTAINIPPPPGRTASPAVRAGGDGAREVNDPRRRALRENASNMPTQIAPIQADTKAALGATANPVAPSPAAQTGKTLGAAATPAQPAQAAQPATPAQPAPQWHGRPVGGERGERGVPAATPAVPAMPAVPAKPAVVVPAAPVVTPANPQAVVAPQVPPRAVPPPPHSSVMETAQHQIEVQRQQEAQRQQEVQRQQEMKRQHDAQTQAARLQEAQRQSEAQAAQQRNVPPPPHAMPPAGAGRPPGEAAPAQVPQAHHSAEPKPAPERQREQKDAKEHQKQEGRGPNGQQEAR